MSWFRETMLKAEAKAEEFENWVKESVHRAADKTQTMADDTVERTNEFVESYQESSESLLDRLPGYAGYKDKERRRDTDRALRNRIADRLDSDANRLESVQRKSASDRDVARVNELEGSVQALRNLANLVRAQSYGYSGLFSDRPVDAAALDQLRTFDEGLLVKVSSLSTTVDAIAAGDAADVGELQAEIERIKAGLRLRDDVIDGGRPIKPSKLSPATTAATRALDDDTRRSEPEAVALPAIQIGDAVSILGDDHIVEAVIDVDAGETGHRFVRIASAPQQWLWFSTDPASPPLRLAGTDDIDVAEWTTTTGRASIRVPDERRRSAPARIETAVIDGATVVRLDIDGVAKSFQAVETHLDDIETYSAK